MMKCEDCGLVYTVVGYSDGEKPVYYCPRCGESRNPMKSYRYVGHSDALCCQTAEGMFVDGIFKVQVDDHGHPFAYGWHEQPREDWERTY